MKRGEIYQLYEKELASIRASAEKHPQAVSMAMNEARRWLDRELDRAEPDDRETAMAKEDPIERWKNSYSGRDLLAKHGLDDEGIWRAYGEDPNCDLGGHHHEPLLGTFQGRLRDVAAYVVTLPGWFQWGGGGRIEEYRPPSIKRITADSIREREDKERRRKQLKAELKRLEQDLGEDDD